MRSLACFSGPLLASVFLCALGLGAGAAQPNQLSAEEQAAGWKLLFNGKDASGWRSFKQTTFPESGWEAKDGWFHCRAEGGGDIITEAEFDDFELEWEWRIAVNGNSGVKYFITETRNSPIGHEYQLIDDSRNDDARQRDGRCATASLYDLIKPVGAPTKPPGEVNQSRVVVKGNHVEHWLNGVKVLEYECGSEALKAAVADSKYKGVTGFADKIKGHLLLQDHHSEVWFRNVKLRELH
jgi:hypothetical protein